MTAAVYRDDDGRRYCWGDDGEVIYLDAEPVVTPTPHTNGHTRMAVDEPSLLAGLRNGAWLDAQVFPPLRYAVPNIVPEGSTLLAGPPKVGKSWFVLGVALGVAAGGRVLGAVEVERRPVFYLALEDGDRRLQDRCRTLLGPGEPIPELFEYTTTVVPGTVLATTAQWLELHRGEEPLIILDTLGKVMPPALMGESSYQRDYRIGSALKRLADDHPGSSLLTNHHDRKAQSEDFVDSVSGTHGLAGAADTVVVLNRGRHETSGLVKVTGRDVIEGEYCVTFDGGGFWQLDGGSFEVAAKNATLRRVTSGVGDRMADVIELVSENPAGVSPADVASALGLDPKQAQIYLARAVSAGRLRRPSRGLYTPVGDVGLLDLVALETNKPTEPTPLLGGDRPSDDNRELYQ